MDRVRKNWIDSDRLVPSRFVRPVLRLTRIEASSGIVLLVAAILAMLWANLELFGDSYEKFWHTQIDVTIGPLHLAEDFRHFVNDGMMAIFFMVVGLEIKRELVLGELRDPRKVALPVVGALGGMLVPAAIYLVLNGSDPLTMQGWGVPMATDIAFSLGILALLGRRIPVGARLFLLAVAIADDIGAITVIAVFYTSDLQLSYLALGIALLVLIWLGARNNIRSMMFYVPLGFAVWFLFLESGVHATIAGVLVGFLTPTVPLYDPHEYDRATRRIVDLFPAWSTEPDFQAKVEYEARLLSDVSRESISPLARLLHFLHNWSAFVIVPVFALANAGVRINPDGLAEALSSRLALGIAGGLVIGKMVGISAFSWLVVRLGLGQLPDGVGWRHIVGVAVLAGVGFTVALFISELAFHSGALLDTAKLGVFAGSLVAGIAGYLILRFEPPLPPGTD